MRDRESRLGREKVLQQLLSFWFQKFRKIAVKISGEKKEKHLVMMTTEGSVHTNDCKDCPCKYVFIADSFFTLAGSNKYQEIKNRLDANPSLVNKLDDYGYSALHYAARENHVSVVRLLLSKGGIPDNNSCGYHIYTIYLFSLH